MDHLPNRIGATKFLVDFHLTIHSLEFSIPDSKLLKITWQKHKTLSETPEFLISPSTLCTQIQSSLLLSKTLYSKNSEFLPKLTKLDLKQKIRNNWVKLSTLTLDLSQYIQNPLIQKDFCLDINGQSCKLNLSIQTEKSQLEIYSAEQNLLETREKFEEVLTEYNENIEEVENMKKNAEKLIEKLEETKRNRNENYLQDKQNEMKKKIQDLKEMVFEESKKTAELQETVNNEKKKLNDEIEEKEITQMSSRLKDIIKRHSVILTLDHS